MMLSFIDNTRPRQRLERPAPPLPLTRSINTSPKSALLVEDDKSLSDSFRTWLEKEGYVVRTASNAEEGLRLYRDCAPFHVVLINYYVPQNNEDEIDCLAPQVHGVRLALAIRQIDPSQGIIIAALDYRSTAEVPRPPEVMDIPLLIDISILHLRSLLEKIEVDQAIKTLSPEELLRLQRFAKFRIRGLGRAALGRDWEDLLEEALYRTLIGAEDNQNGRHWNKKVTFVQHLAGVMSSIASVWKRQFTEKNTYLMSEISVHGAEGQEHSPFDNVPAKQIPADERLIEKSEEERAFAVVADDPGATQVLRGIVDGLRKNEILCRYDLDEKKYAAALKRIRLKLAGDKNNRGRGTDNGR